MKNILELETDQKNPGICPNFIQVNRKKNHHKINLKRKWETTTTTKIVIVYNDFKYILVGLTIENIACLRARKGLTPVPPWNMTGRLKQIADVSVSRCQCL